MGMEYEIDSLPYCYLMFNLPFLESFSNVVDTFRIREDVLAKTYIFNKFRTVVLNIKVCLGHLCM